MAVVSPARRDLADVQIAHYARDMPSSDPLHISDRFMLAAALTGAAEALVEVTSGLWEVAPSEGSAGHALLSGPLYGSPFADVTISLAAASDEFSAFAWVLGGDGAYGPSLGALLRSCVEALGRAWWLMNAEDAAELAHRAALLTLDESGYLARNGGEAATRGENGEVRRLSGAEISNEARRRFEDVRVAGLSANAPGYRALAVALLDAVDSPNPGRDYSTMSGISHGEKTSLTGLANVRSGQTGLARVGLDLTIEAASLFIWILVECANQVMNTLFDMWGESSDELHRRWATAHGDAVRIIEPTFRRLMEQ